LIFKNGFTFDKPGHTECDHCDGFKPEHWSETLNQGFDWWYRGNNNDQQNRSKDGISADTVDDIPFGAFEWWDVCPKLSL
jgi:hypothetical protein